MTNQVRDLVRVALEALDEERLGNITHSELHELLVEINFMTTTLEPAHYCNDDSKTTGLFGVQHGN